MTTTAKPLAHIILLDAALLGVACLVPAVSHLLALPLYMLNPMMALLLAAILLGRDWRNALLMAVLLPAVSYLLVGMPTAPKMFCMMAELATVVVAFHWLNRRLPALPAVLTAAVAGKVIYYTLKAIVIAPATLVGTEWTVQLLAVMLWGGLFALLYKKG